MSTVDRFSITRIALCLFLVLCASTAPGATISSKKSGVWSDTATWNGNTLPLTADSVRIRAGDTVTIDESPICSMLTIDGLLQFADVAVYYTLLIDGDLIVDASGTLRAAESANNYAINWVYVSGTHLTINGTYIGFVTGAHTRGIGVSMIGSGSHIGGTASGIDFTGYLEVNVPGSTVALDTAITVSGELYLTDGTLNNAAHNVTMGPNAALWRWHASAGVAVKPLFSGTTQLLHYNAAMT
jgi:hypothetical protein